MDARRRARKLGKEGRTWLLLFVERREGEWLRVCG